MPARSSATSIPRITSEKFSTLSTTRLCGLCISVLNRRRAWIIGCLTKQRRPRRQQVCAFHNLLASRFNLEGATYARIWSHQGCSRIWLLSTDLLWRHLLQPEVASSREQGRFHLDHGGSLGEVDLRYVQGNGNEGITKAFE